MDKDSRNQLNKCNLGLGEVVIKEEDDDSGEYNGTQQGEDIEIPLFPGYSIPVKIEHDETQNIDPKLLMSPIVYTKKLDNMKVLHASYYGQSTATIINKIIKESKPHLEKNIDSTPTWASFGWVKLRVTQLKKKIENEGTTHVSKCDISPNDENKQTKQMNADPLNKVRVTQLKRKCALETEGTAHVSKCDISPNDENKQTKQMNADPLNKVRVTQLKRKCALETEGTAHVSKCDISLNDENKETKQMNADPLLKLRPTQLKRKCALETEGTAHVFKCDISPNDENKQTKQMNADPLNKVRVTQLKRKCALETEGTGHVSKCDISLNDENKETKQMKADPLLNLRPTQLKGKCALENVGTAHVTKCDISPNDKTEETKQKNTDPLINKELLKMCKPLSIPLQKVDGKVANSLRTLERFVNSEKTLRLIIADRNTNEIDIYCVQGKVNIEHYIFKEVNDEKLMYYEKLFGVKRIVVCCWYQRENVIRTLSNLDFSDNFKKIMRRPHFCFNDRCSCCCRIYKPHKIQNDKAECSEKVLEDISVKSLLPEDVEIQNLEQELTETFKQIEYYRGSNKYRHNWLQDLMSETSNNTLINKALSYNPPKKDTKKSFPKTTPEKSLHLKRFHFRTKETECVELTQHGIIEMHAKLAPNSEFKIVLNNLYSSGYEDYRFCCWKRRVSIIKINFTSVDDSTADLRRFLNAQHTCAAGKCRCCCFRNSSSAQLHLGDITLPERITSTHTVNVLKVTKNVSRNQPVVSHSMPAVRPVLPYTLPIDIDDNDESQSTPVNSEEVDDCIIVDVEPSPTTKNQVATTIKDSNSIPSTNTKPLPKHTPQPDPHKIPISANINNQTSAVDSMVTTILDRFKNVRLTINETGEVAASLNSPVNSLTTDELKMLANILAHAQRQVQVIKFANSSKGAGAANVQGTIANNLPFAQPAAAPVSPVVGKMIPVQVPQTTQPIILRKMPRTTNMRQFTNNPKNILPKTNASSQQNSRKLIFENFAQLLSKKNSKALSSFTAFIKNNNTSEQEINEQKLDEPVIPQIPVISNVFSLKDTNNINANPNEINSALKSWSEETTQTQKAPTILVAPLETPSLKRKSEEKSAPSASKIRVVDPAKLGITKSFDDPAEEADNQSRRLNLSSGGFLTSNNLLAGATVVPAEFVKNIQNQPKLFYLGKSQNILNPRGTVAGTTLTKNDNIPMTTLNSSNLIATQTPADTYRIQYLGDKVQLVPVAVVGNNTIVAPQHQPVQPQFASQHVIRP